MSDDEKQSRPERDQRAVAYLVDLRAQWQHEIRDTLARLNDTIAALQVRVTLLEEHLGSTTANGQALASSLQDLLTDPLPASSKTYATLENLIQQLDDRDLNEALDLIQTLFERDHRPGDDGGVVSLVPVQRPSRRLDD